MTDEIKIISESSELYPPLLREITQPPAQLYIRGNIEILQNEYLLAVVGSRSANHYGKQAIGKILPDAIKAGLVVVSGLAYGIDALSHNVCVSAERPTIAVLGSGIDDRSIYPRPHIHLAHQILSFGGAIISEYEPGTHAFPGHFPARNRIISGLCTATLIVQAAQRSGSLITARLALETNRDVCAIPGNITDPLAFGTNHLIQSGAIPILETQDLLDLYNLKTDAPAAKPLAYSSPQHEQIMQHLSDMPQHIDQLVDQTKLPIDALSVILMELELAGHVENAGGMQYTKK